MRCDITWETQIQSENYEIHTEKTKPWMLMHMWTLINQDTWWNSYSKCLLWSRLQKGWIERACNLVWEELSPEDVVASSFLPPASSSSACLDIAVLVHHNFCLVVVALLSCSQFGQHPRLSRGGTGKAVRNSKSRQEFEQFILPSSLWLRPQRWGECLALIPHTKA